MQISLPAIGGNYVNRFNIAGRSYKVIPQIKRVDRLNPQQLENIYVTGPNNKLIPLSTVATIKHKTVARSLNRMQQLNAVTISGVPARSIDAALKFLEDEARKILPKGYVIDYTGESRQLRTEGDKFVPVFVLSIVLIFLVLAAQFNSFRDPFIVLLGSVPLALFGAVIFMFLKMPFGTFFTNGWTTSLNIYSQVGLVTLVGLVSRNGILIVQFANEMQRKGMDKTDRGGASRADSVATDHDDERCHCCWSLPADARDWRRRGCEKLNRSRSRRRDDHRDNLHAVHRSVALHAPRERASRKIFDGRGLGRHTRGCRISRRKWRRRSRQMGTATDGRRRDLARVGETLVVAAEKQEPQ